MRAVVIFALALLAAGCVSYESAYERAVYDEEPVYCYRTIGTVDCYRKPVARDQRQLVNYFGPAPGKYRKPSPPSVELSAPPEVDDYARAPEPVAGKAASQVAATAATPGAAAAQPPVAAAAGEKDDWRVWLPVVSVLFGAAQAVAAFAF